MTQSLVVVDPMWFSAADGRDRARGARLGNAGRARRRARLARIANACVEASVATRPIDVSRVWAGLGESDFVDDDGVLDGITLLPALGSFLVPTWIATAIRRHPLLGLHVVEHTVPAPSGPFSDEPATDAGWHLRAVRGSESVIDGGEGVVVGVLDTGIDASHPELSHAAISYASFAADGSISSKTPRDHGMHGTHVAGIVAGSSCGVAPKASLAVAAVMTPRGTAASFAAGLEWLLDGDFGRSDGARGVDVINASVGFSVDDPRLRTLIRRALCEHGVLTVAASGNDGASGPDRCAAPAIFPETVAVGAVDQHRVVASFSAYGVVRSGTSRVREKPEISAPGVAIRSCVPGGRYRSLSATSMAAPIVTGVAAVLISRRPELRGRPSALRAALLDSVVAPARPHPRFGNTGGAGVVAVD